MVFEFQTPFIIAATPPDDSDWGICEAGCRNGLRVRGHAGANVSISVDRGTTWHDGGRLNDAIDVTDFAKGHRQYWLKFDSPAGRLADAGIEIVTICQANGAVFPRLKDGGSTVTFAASGHAVVSAGPNKAQAQPHVVDGAFDTPTVTLELQSPRGERAVKLYAAAHVASSNPPDPQVRYQIDYSTDGGKTWHAVVRDWHIVRQGVEPSDFWSQSFCYGDVSLGDGEAGPIRIRFRNDGGKRILRAEAHLVYTVPQEDRCRVTFAWSDDQGKERTSEQTFDAVNPAPWSIDTGKDIVMKWVEFGVVR